MSDLRDLYQEVILEHQKSPRNFRVLEDANFQADGDNPLCGDKVTVYARMDGDVLMEVGFQGKGCSICMASASLMTERIKGADRKTIAGLFENFHDFLTGKTPGDEPPLDKLEVMGGVSQYPVRVKCATLPWHTLKAALDGGEAVTTE